MVQETSIFIWSFGHVPPIHNCLRPIRPKFHSLGRLGIYERILERALCSHTCEDLYWCANQYIWWGLCNSCGFRGVLWGTIPTSCQNFCVRQQQPSCCPHKIVHHIQMVELLDLVWWTQDVAQHWVGSHPTRDQVGHTRKSVACGQSTVWSWRTKSFREASDEAEARWDW